MKIIATDFKWLVIIFYSGIYPKAVRVMFFFCYKSKFIVHMKSSKLLDKMTLIINHKGLILGL